MEWALCSPEIVSRYVLTNHIMLWLGLGLPLFVVLRVLVANILETIRLRKIANSN